MSIKDSANTIVNNLPDDASWNDLVKALIKEKKITLGMTDIEIAQDELSEADISTIIARLQGSQAMPDDMRNTKVYHPSDAVTLGMVAGVVAIFFSLVFPPIAWASALVALVAGIYGLSKSQPKAWVPILMSAVSIVPMFFIVG